MKILILLVVASFAVVSQAGPQTPSTVREVHAIAENTNDGRRRDDRWRQEGITYLTNLYVQPLDSAGQSERTSVVAWLVESAKPGTADLSPLFTQILKYETVEPIRYLALRGMGNSGTAKLAAQVHEQLFPPPSAKFLVYTSVREEAARSLGKLSRRYPQELDLSATLEVLERAAADPALLTGAVDGIALCGMEKEPVQKLLSKILLAERGFPELARIRVAQWYRQSPISDQRSSDLRTVAESRQTRVALSAIHTLLATRTATPGTAAALKQIVVSQRHTAPELVQYAERLQQQGGLADELTRIGPSVTEVCRVVLGGA